MANSLVILGRAATVVALGLVVSGCPRRAEEPVPPAQPLDTSEPPQLPTPVQTALSRADLIAGGRSAASGYAAGAAVEGADPLVGRTFSVVVPVGCAGPAASLPVEAADGLARVAWNADRSAIQFSLAPGDWTASALIAGSRGEWEDVEGIWVPRPWLETEACPTVRTDPIEGVPASPTGQTLGLAVVHDEEGSRLNRRNGRAYAFTLRGDNNAPAAWPTGGLRLRLEGRVVGFPGGSAFRCRATSPDTAPVCVVAVQLDRVALEASSGTTLSEWRDG